MSEYKPISDYGVIGNLRAAALVAKNGSIDWACLPDLDSPSVFARLLDSRRGGHFRVWVPEATTQGQAYAAQTNVLLTRFGCSSGIGEVEDLMPIEGRHAILRIVRAIGGPVRFRAECLPRFDYGRQQHRTHEGQDIVHFESPSLCLDLTCPTPYRLVESGVESEFTLSAGESVIWILSARGVQEQRPQASALKAAFEDAPTRTLDYWRQWLAQCPYRGRWRREVERSLLVLKLLTHRPSGGIAAAVTTSLPEVIGGENNWDYRFCWVRDACWTVDAFMSLGYQEEARAFMGYLAHRRDDGGSRDPLDVAYSLSGTSLEETTLDHLEGYRGSRPVRVGNAAAFQRQLDVYGEYARAALRFDAAVDRISHEDWRWLQSMGAWLIDHLDDADAGLWESRGERKHFVHSKVQIWVALDSLLELASRRSLPLDVNRVRQARDQVADAIRRDAWSHTRTSYTATFGGSEVDAALLFLEQSGLFCAADDPFMETLATLEKELLIGRALMRRRRDERNAFCACSFWLAEVLARCGRRERARDVLERMLTYANHLDSTPKRSRSTATS
ncbi:MAG: glycoside hydrolase family 15 protein [Polyangiaceae bacterium]